MEGVGDGLFSACSPGDYVFRAGKTDLTRPELFLHLPKRTFQRDDVSVVGFIPFNEVSIDFIGFSVDNPGATVAFIET